MYTIKMDPQLQDQRVSSSSPVERRSPHHSFSEAAAPASKLASESTKSRDPTLIDYLYTELRRGYDLGNDEQRYRERREKFYIFLKIPVQLEKVRSSIS